MTAILTNRVERTRFLKFLVVGVFGAGVDFGTLNVLTRILGVYPTIAQAISFCFAVISNFLWNRYWIYPESRAKSARQQGIQFLLVNIVGLAIRTPIFAFLQSFFSKESVLLPATFSSSTKISLATNLALAVSVMAVMMWNFFVNRYWTYKDVDNGK